MEANECDVNRVNTDALLPPRKRLLAGFKRQISDIEASSSSTLPSVVIAPSTSIISLSSPSYPALTSSDFNHRLDLFLSSHLDKYQKMSPYQIVEASKSAANEAIKAAEIARAAAHEKSVIAAKAVSAAKASLALVVSYPEEGLASGREINPKKNKLKKQVQVQVLYKKHKLVGNRDTKHINNDGNPFLDTSDETLVADVESDHSIHVASARAKEKTNSPPTKKRGRMKLKKLPLSMCNFRDQKINKEDTVQRAITVKPLFPVEPLAGNDQTSPVWKCEGFKDHNVKQNKVLQF